MHQEGPHMQMPRQPNNRMFRTMSVPHMAMGPGQQQPMYSDYSGQVTACSQTLPAAGSVLQSQAQSLSL